MNTAGQVRRPVPEPDCAGLPAQGSSIGPEDWVLPLFHRGSPLLARHSVLAPWSTHLRPIVTSGATPGRAIAEVDA